MKSFCNCYLDPQSFRAQLLPILKLPASILSNPTKPDTSHNRRILGSPVCSMSSPDVIQIASLLVVGGQGTFMPWLNCQEECSASERERGPRPDAVQLDRNGCRMEGRLENCRVERTGDDLPGVTALTSFVVYLGLKEYLRVPRTRRHSVEFLKDYREMFFVG
jgi:hypothetical protein